MKHALLLGVAGALLAAPALAQTPSTSEFVNKVAQSDMLEIQSSQFVAPNADADTKPFAERMIRDHTQTSNELKELVGSGKVRAELPAMLDAEHQKKLDDLKKLSGRELDRQYDQMQMQAHKEAVDLFGRYAQGGDNNDLKSWAEKTLPHLREHLTMAQKLDQGGSTVGAAPAPVGTGGQSAQILASLPGESMTVTHWYKQNVYDPGDNKIGDIKDVLVDKDGKMIAMIVGVGGFLGIGEKDVAVPFNAVQFKTKDNNKFWPVLNTTKDVLKGAPGYKYDRTAMAWIPENAPATTGGPATTPPRPNSK